MSFILLGILNSQASGGQLYRYWLTTSVGSGTQFARGAAIDSQDNILSGGRTTSGAADAATFKWNTNGELQWSKSLGGSETDISEDCALDSDDNVYSAGFRFSDNIGYLHDQLIIKRNSDGVLQWQRYLSGYREQAAKIRIDSGSNIYIVGRGAHTGSPGDISELITKWNTSGTLQWSRWFGKNTYQYGNALAIDPTGSPIMAAAGGGQIDITKWNSSGTLTWARRYYDAGYPVPYEVVTDSSNNIYITGATNRVSPTFRTLIIKYDSSGSGVWQRTLGTDGHQGRAMAIDSSSNIYVVSYIASGGEGANEIGISKWNSSGTIQWQRTFGSQYDDYAGAVAIDSLGDLCFTGDTKNSSGDVHAFAFKLPTDGSLTGTYTLNGVDYVYAASSFTVATVNYSFGTGDGDASTATSTTGTPSLTDGTPSLTNYLVGIPE